MSNQLLLRRRTMLGQSKEVAIHGIPPISITGKRNLLSVKAFGECVQNGTPTPDNPIDIVCNNGVLKVDNQGNLYVDGIKETITITSDGGTATAEMLLKVGDYQDVQSILDGVVTRNVGIKVLDGTENFTALSTPNCFRFSFSPMGIDGVNPICSHYPAATITLSVANMPDQTIKGHVTAVNSFYLKDSRFTTKEELQAWLAAQYAAGTPVIVVYPLATPTIEEIIGQTLVLTSDTNIIDITQASLKRLELEVRLK